MDTQESFVRVSRLLLLLCWYLDYDRDGDYSSSTRHDFLEEVIQEIRHLGPEDLALLEKARDQLIKMYASHPFKNQIEKSMRELFVQIMQPSASKIDR